MPVTHRILLCLCLVLIAKPAAAIGFKSSSQQATVIELYTSQGCSSCPPAEEFLNSLKANNLLWKSYFPLAFHVDYWDYLGWKDRFAKPQHRVRQEAYANINHQRTIYTPGFYVNGAPWRRGMFERTPPLSKNETGMLSVDLQEARLKAEFRPVKPTGSELVLNVAIVGMDLKTDIQAGENSGRHSNHEFVVLHQQSLTSRDGYWQLTLTNTHFEETRRLALVVWVSREDDPRPLQAAGGYISFE